MCSGCCRRKNLNCSRRILWQHRLNRGDTLIKEGEAHEALFLIVSGTVEIAREEHGTHHVLARLGPGRKRGAGGPCSPDSRRP